MSRATEDILAALHGAVAQEFMRKIQSGEATASDLAAAAKFLKDNGIDCVGRENTGMISLAASMDFPVDVDELQH